MRAATMVRYRDMTVVALLSALTLAAVRAETPAAQSSWQNVERVIAFADVHGSYADLVPLLRRAGVIDAESRWAAGAAHVVSLGDLLDRGGESRKVLDLLMRLQNEATAAGGRLHVVLGNHEAMNVLGDLRYVVAEEYASYAADEPVGERDRQRERWTAAGKAAADFDRQFPPGYFGHRALLGPTGRYGSWLLALPVAISIDDTLFMHGGPSPVLAGQKLAEINLRYRTALTDHLRTSAALAAAGLIEPGDEFHTWSKLAQQRLAARGAQEPDAAALQEAVRQFDAADRNPMLEPDGPNWYRGAALCNECAERDVLDPLLAGLGVERLVIGHTVGRGGRVATRFDGAVYKLDAGMNRAVYKGHPAALVIERGQTPVVLYGDDIAPPAAAPAEGRYLSSQALTESQVEALLANGNVTVKGPRAPDVIDVTVERDGAQVAAIFVAADRTALGRELAAWRLDQLLGLGVVPATVEREVQGRRGYLQGRPARWVSQAEAQAQGMRGGGNCAFEPQFQLLYAFDALSGNQGRTPERLLFDTGQWSVFATGHDRAFGAGSEFPPYLKATPPKPGNELRRRLTELNAAAIADALGSWLSEREQRALLTRRDTLLQQSPAAAGTAR
jgi:hypothetical protein